MSNREFLMPQMGESITEATILTWAKAVGDMIEEDETLLEIATDKVDSELPSPFAGKIIDIRYKEGEVVSVGSVIAVIEVEGESEETADARPAPKDSALSKSEPSLSSSTQVSTSKTKNTKSIQSITANRVGQGQVSEREIRPSQTNRFYSPLVRSIAEIEGLSVAELDGIVGSGSERRVTKSDIASYVHDRSIVVDKGAINYKSTVGQSASYTAQKPIASSYSGAVEIVEMDRMRRMIADHMVRSKHTSPHVTSFLEIDITSLVAWREQIKDEYFATHGEKITYTPIFIHAVANAIKDFPAINASVDGYNIVLKKSINIGMATATASGNLIVPVIKDADHIDLDGLVTSVNDLAIRARNGKLKPDEVQGGTFTLTNVGTFGNTMGTPIINQPQAAILSVGAIRKKPGVVGYPDGDKIEIRKYMFLSLSYDHRIVDGSLGGSFLRRVGDYLEGFEGVR